MTDETADLSLALSRTLDLARSLFASVECTRPSARAHTYIHASRVHAYRDVRGFLSFVTANSRFTLRVPHPLAPGLSDLFGSSPSSFLQIVEPNAFRHTVFGGCFNRSFKQSLSTLPPLSLSLSFSLLFLLSIAFSSLLFSLPRQCVIFFSCALVPKNSRAHLQLETINNCIDCRFFLPFLKFIKTRMKYVLMRRACLRKTNGLSRSNNGVSRYRVPLST